MLRVLEVISDMNIGGAGRLLINRIKNMDKERFDVTVIVPKGSMLSDFLKRENVTVLEVNGSKDKSFEIKSLLAFLKLIKRVSPDIINCHGSMNARVAAKLARVKIKIFTRHCDFPLKGIYKSGGIRSFLGLFNNFISDGAIAVSDSAKRNLLELGIKEEKIKVIINGAQPQIKLSDDEKRNFKEKLNISQDKVLVSIFARIEEYKDHITFLKAANVLREYNCLFVIVGTGREEANIKRYVKELDLEKKVLFVGFVNDITPWMNITDINVNCSVGTETSSLALSEGMSLGIPCVVSDYPGNTYMIRDKENGLVFPQGDHRALAKKIKCLIENRDLYNKLSDNAFKRFESELNAKSMTLKTEEYYLELYNKKTCNNTDL